MAPPPVYLDECVAQDAVGPLRQRGIVVSTARAANMLGASDEDQLRYATLFDYVLVTHNERHFWRAHLNVLRLDQHHAGIITMPVGTHLPAPMRTSVLVVRIALLVAWLTDSPTYENQFFRWADLQFRLTQGERLPGFSEDEVRLALGQVR